MGFQGGACLGPERSRPAFSEHEHSNADGPNCPRDSAAPLQGFVVCGPWPWGRLCHGFSSRPFPCVALAVSRPLRRRTLLHVRPWLRLCQGYLTLFIVFPHVWPDSRRGRARGRCVVARSCMFGLGGACARVTHGFSSRLVRFPSRPCSRPLRRRTLLHVRPWRRVCQGFSMFSLTFFCVRRLGCARGRCVVARSCMSGPAGSDMLCHHS